MSSPKVNREYVDRGLSAKSIEAVSPREMQRELKEAACDPIDFEAEYNVPPPTPPPLVIQKQMTLDDIDQDWAKSELF
jgi:hypothetical protein